MRPGHSSRKSGRSARRPGRSAIRVQLRTGDAARLRPGEGARGQRRGRDAQRGLQAQRANPAPQGREELREPAEELEARFHLEHEPGGLDRDRGRVLRGPAGQALERFPFRALVAIDAAQVPREGLGRRDRHALAHARRARGRIGARDHGALRGPFAHDERQRRGLRALHELQGQCGQFERDPEHGRAPSGRNARGVPGNDSGDERGSGRRCTPSRESPGRFAQRRPAGNANGDGTKERRPAALRERDVQEPLVLRDEHAKVRGRGEDGRPRRGGRARRACGRTPRPSAGGEARRSRFSRAAKKEPPRTRPSEAPGRLTRAHPRPRRGGPPGKRRAARRPKPARAHREGAAG